MSTFTLHKNDPGRALVETNLISFISKLPKEKSFRVIVEPHTKDYSAKQRRSIFGPAYKALMEFCGLEGSADKDALHRDMCGEYFGWLTLGLGRKPMRTTTIDERGQKNPISVQEALQFYEFLQRKGIEIGCYVPDPDPLWREHRGDVA